MAPVCFWVQRILFCLIVQIFFFSWLFAVCMLFDGPQELNLRSTQMHHPTSSVVKGSFGFWKPCSNGWLHAALRAKMELAQGKKKKDDKKEHKKKKTSDGATDATAMAEGDEGVSAAEGHLKAVVDDDTGNINHCNS